MPAPGPFGRTRLRAAVDRRRRRGVQDRRRWAVDGGTVFAGASTAAERSVGSTRAPTCSARRTTSTACCGSSTAPALGGTCPAPHRRPDHRSTAPGSTGPTRSRVRGVAVTAPVRGRRGADGGRPADVADRSRTDAGDLIRPTLARRISDGPTTGPDRGPRLALADDLAVLGRDARRTLSQVAFVSDSDGSPGDPDHRCRPTLWPRPRDVGAPARARSTAAGLPRGRRRTRLDPARRAAPTAVPVCARLTDLHAPTQRRLTSTGWLHTAGSAGVVPS